MTAFVTQPDSISPLSGSGGHTISSSPKPYVAVDSSESDWPLSDFIRQHIIEHKLNTDAMTRKEFKRTMSRSKMTTSGNAGAGGAGTGGNGSGETTSPAAQHQHEGNNKRSISRPRSSGGRVPSPAQSAFVAEQSNRKSPSYAFLTGSRDDNDDGDNEQQTTSAVTPRAASTGRSLSRSNSFSSTSGGTSGGGRKRLSPSERLLSKYSSGSGGGNMNSNSNFSSHSHADSAGSFNDDIVAAAEEDGFDFDAYMTAAAAASASAGTTAGGTAGGASTNTKNKVTAASRKSNSNNNSNYNNNDISSNNSEWAHSVVTSSEMDDFNSSQGNKNGKQHNHSSSNNSPNPSSKQSPSNTATATASKTPKTAITVAKTVSTAAKIKTHPQHPPSPPTLNNSSSGHVNGAGTALDDGAQADDDYVRAVLEGEREQREREVEARLAARLEGEIAKRMESVVERMVDERVAAAVQDITQKYDFIINKLVAAVDAEFTLLNNQLKLANSPADGSGRKTLGEN